MKARPEPLFFSLFSVRLFLSDYDSQRFFVTFPVEISVVCFV
jgi:hypothetical protein